MLLVLLTSFLFIGTFSLPAHGLEYTFAAPDAGVFAEPTSDDTIYVPATAAVNTDRSKNAALIPPPFGSPTSYLLNSGEPLTPNLQSNVTLSGGVVTGVTIMPPSLGSISGQSGNAGTSYTAVTADLYYTGGHIGTLRIPAINLSVKVYQGSDSSILAKGAGHFESTSFFTGNTALAAHNRGAADYFGEIHTLDAGDSIQLDTKLGTRRYEVYSVTKVSAADLSVLDDSGTDILTLITCVMNQPDYRWCVRAIAVDF